MTYAHSFSPDFYGDSENPQRSDRPTCIVDALASLPEDRWSELIRDVFPGRRSEHVALDEVLERVIETNTVSNLDVPVEVWIDNDGFHRVRVYDALSPPAEARAAP
ncbi:MAG: hypothetical protein FLDDKLPJ_03612 [Phycisphaerae bacterium]|nr:hypothetical protein [Phycisphaerae bacterium]